MSISTIATKDSYVGNNSNSTPYPITFKYFDSDHVTVYADGVEISSGGLNYCTFSGDGATGTGEFITSAIYAPAVTITVVLDVPLDQPVVLQETGSLPAKTIEVEGFDRLNMQIRRVWRKLGDVLTFSSDEGGTGSTGTADNLLGFDGSGDIAEIPNTTFLQTANDLSDVTAATARTNLGVDAAGTDNSTDVTKTGAGTYISLAGQVLTVDEITETDLNTSTNASLDLADTALQSGVAAASDIVDFDTEVANNTTVAANTNDRHVAATKSGTGTYVSLNVQDIVVNPIQDGDVDSEASTSDKVLKSDGASGAAWGNVEGTEVKSTGEAAGDSFLRENGDGTCSWIALSGLGLGNALVENPLSQFATTTAAQLAGVITAGQTEGTGDLVFATSPALVTPDLGIPTAIDLVNATNTPLPAADSITYDIIQDVTAADKILGSVAGGTVSEITCTSAGRDLLDDADASAQRTTMGVAIGSDVQAHSSVLDDIVTLPSVTGSTVFTRSSNNISIAGVGLLGDNGGAIEVGDVIEVTGTAFNDNTYTVTSVTDNDNIVVNIEHKAAAGIKTLTDETVAATTTRICKAVNAPVGLGQGWIEQTRLFDSWYENLTGRAIQVTLVSQQNGTSGCHLRMDVGDPLGIFIQVAEMHIDDASGATRDQCISAIVPAGSSYRPKGGNVNLKAVTELK